ncbi:c6 zinc finger domain-containing protein [Colletotrichum incanum]|uniref:C6 zinc finger domain-containing protein n=1 Tax=Colletotrichum incanum TaxID=1573173 RepID=A0A167CBT8_COLIC|nr:c6 zinc finger domain-containing protein [Colletotrichum incanum]
MATSAMESAFDLESPTVPSLYTPATNPFPVGAVCDSGWEAKATKPWASHDAADALVISDVLVRLSKLNLELHVRAVVVDANKRTINLDSMLYQNGPLFLNNLTLAEFMLKASQDFLTIIIRLMPSQQVGPLLEPAQSASYYPNMPLSLLLSSQKKPHLWPYTSLPAPTKTVSSPLALIMTSVFTQLLTLLEVNLEHLIPRIRRMHVEPITPVRDLTFGGITLAEPCTQGIVFSKAIIHLLERIESALGIGEGSSGQMGLLSERQKEVLWSELGGDIGMGHAPENCNKSGVPLNEDEAGRWADEETYAEYLREAEPNAKIDHMLSDFLANRNPSLSRVFLLFLECNL